MGVTVHVLHIGKTGGTALKHALAPVAEARGIVLHDHETRLTDIPSGERAVLVLRDPLARFVSAFHSRRRQGRPRHDWPWSEGERAAYAHFDDPDALACAFAAGDPEAIAAMEAIAHIRTPQVWWTGSPEALRARRDDLLLVGRCETLADDFARLRALLALPADLRLPTGDVEAHRNPPGADTRLSEPSREALRRHYAADLALLGAAAAL